MVPRNAGGRAFRKIQFASICLMVLAILGSCSAETPMPLQVDPAPAISGSAQPDSGGGEIQPESTEEIVCPETSPHPVAADIADTFDVEYELVIGWFCDGYPFDEILLALQTQKIVDVEVESLLEERVAGKSWDDIWRDLEIVSD